MSSFANLFDAYSLRARLYPGFLAALPAVSLVVLLWPKSPLQALWPVLVGVGALLFLANWVRDHGRKIEPGLHERWGGTPTTKMLRYTDSQDMESFRRRRRLLGAVVAIDLPSRDEEAANPKAADNVYMTATKALIVRVRAKQDKFPRIQDENTDYGFRRNLFAMKPFGLPIAMLALVFDAAWLILDGAPVTWILVAVHVLIALAWWRVVTDEWVKRQAENYATRLFEALEDPELQN